MLLGVKRQIVCPVEDRQHQYCCTAYHLEHEKQPGIVQRKHVVSAAACVTTHDDHHPVSAPYLASSTLAQLHQLSHGH